MRSFRLFIIILLLSLAGQVYSQNVGIGTSTPEPSAILEIKSTDKGLLIPRLETSAVNNPAEGLMIFQPSTSNFMYFNGSAWEAVGGKVVDADGDTRIEAVENGFRDTIRIFVDGDEELNISRNFNGDLNVEPLFNSPGNTFYGWRAGRTNFGTNNTVFGNNALAKNTSGSLNTSIGARALGNNTSGEQNVAIGFESLNTNTEGSNNVVIGLQSLIFNDLGSHNTAIGWCSGFNNFGSNNIFIGSESGKNEAGSNKLYIENSDGDKDNALIYGEFDNKYLQINGRQEVKLIDGDENSAIKGIVEFTSESNAHDIPAILGENISIDEKGTGVQGRGGKVGVRGEVSGNGGSVYSGTIGHSNGVNQGINSGIYGFAANGATNIGVYGKTLFTSGENWAGYFFGKAYIDDSLKVNGIGHFKNELEVAGLSTFEDDILVNGLVTIGGAPSTLFPLTVKTNGGGGADNVLKIYDSSGGETWHLRLQNGGNIGYTETGVADNVFVLEKGGNIGIGISDPAHPLHLGTTLANGAHCTAAGVWTNGSDRRLKKQIQEISYGLNEIMKLRPVAYKMKSNDEDQIGFIAQEVREILPELISGKEGDIEEGETLGMGYGQLTSVIVKAMQEQQNIIENLKSELANQSSELELLKAGMAELKAAIEKKNQD
ncbi:tail fiber domain-containing protein [Portibacter lacus]|nr:tail fiber domain-containing protein [Portibacter lacus]